jgi:hypothetical protein
MKGYPIIGVLWQDHITRVAQELPENPDDVVEVPTLTVGILLRETDRTILIAHDLELGTDVATYTVLYKNAVMQTTLYGEIELELGGD